MSKKCEVCKRSYPDDLDACPHCAEVVEIGEADVVDLGSSTQMVVEEFPEIVPATAPPVTPSAVGPDSAVDLGLPALPADPNGSGSHPSGEGSGISVIQWASLVEEEPQQEPATVSFDDPADADLIRHAPPATAVPPTAPPPGTEATLALPPVDEGEDALAADLEAVRTLHAGDASASFARRGPAQPAEPPADDDSALNLLASAEVEEVPPTAPPPVHAAADAESEVDLGAPPPASESASQKGIEPEVLEMVGSGVDLTSAELEEEIVAEAAAPAGAGGDLPAMLPEEEAVSFLKTRTDFVREAGGDPSAMLPEEDAVAVVRPPTALAPNSGIDLDAAEVVEEGPVAPAAFADVVASDSDIDLGGAEVVDVTAPSGASEVHVVDSGVDLSAAEVVDVAPPAEPAEEAVIRPISDSGIDLSPIEATGSDSGPQAGIEQNTPGTTDSGVDRIAAEVESGMNLRPEPFEFVSDSKSGSGADRVDEIVLDESATALTAGQLPSGEEEVDLNEMPAASDAVDSSAVDLGASATFPAAPPEPASDADELESTRPYEGKEKSIHGEEEISPSEVDLGARHGGDSGRDFFQPSEGMAEAPEAPADEEEESLIVDEDELPPAAEDELEPAAVEDEEGTALDEEEETAPPPKKEKRRSTAGAWVGGLFLGGVVTAGVLLGLWLFKIEPPTAWRGFLPGGNASPASNAPNVAPLTSANKTDLVRSGDLDQAAKAGVETANEADPAEVALRGQYRVRKYLMDASLGQKTPKADDADMANGMKDLNNVKDNNDDALFWLAVAKEAVHDPKSLKEAKDLYEQGKKNAKDDQARQRFQDGLNRLAAQGVDVSRAAPALDPALLILIATGLAADPPAPPAPPDQGPPAEAGSKFWEAAKAAQDGKFDDAVKALDTAIGRHKLRRFAVLGKAQNPSSDPTEEIFLRSCQELQAYWALRLKLQGSGLPIVMNKDAGDDVAALIAADKKLTGDLAVAATNAKTLQDMLKKAGDDLTDANTKLTDANTKLTDANTKLTDANTKLTDTQTKLDDANTAKKKTEADLAASLKKADDLTAALAKKTDTLKGVADALKAANALKEGDDETAVVPAVKQVLQDKDVLAVEKRIRDLKDKADKTIRELTDKTDKAIGDLTAENKRLTDARDSLQAAAKDHWQPEQMLTFWLPLLLDRTHSDLAANAIADADRVLKNDKASATDKARAHAVKGIALRVEEKYAEAKAELGQARADLSKDDGVWVLETETALTEATDPAGYYAAKAEEYRREGRTTQAAAMLSLALKAAPERADLRAERGALHLDEALARGKGRVAADDADLAAAREDADEAKKAGAAEAFYLGGRIAEAQGKPDAAAVDYGKALAAHGGLDAAGFRYRAALARALMLQARDGQGQPDDLVTRALKLADEVATAKGADVPFEARAQALAIQGLWTEALTTFVDGLYPHISPERARVLTAVVQGHPALRRPTPMTVADPTAAAKHFAAGLQWYNDREYDKSEKEFITAVQHDGQDARYYYYLGLSRLQQGDRDAFEDFEQGARLERENRPSRAAVSAALERVQGEARERLNEIRDRPR